MAQDMIHHRKSAFKLVMAELQERLRLLFGTAQPVMPLACSGSGVMTAAVTNLFAPGEKVIVVDGGKFGERWIKISEGHGLQVVTVKVEWGNAVSVAEVEAALDAHPDARGLLIQNSETSTGALHPVHLLGGLTRARNMLLVVDGISSVGISPCPMDELDIDCLVTGSQKGLMLPPGLGLIALSERAWAKAETVPPACFYFNLLSERANCLKNQTLFTTPVSLIIGLNESMKMFMEAGLDTVYRKQWALTMFARTSVKEMGLELLAKDRFTWGLTSVMLPEGIDGSKLLEIAAERFGVYMAGGQDHLKGRAIRIGHMGWVDWADLAAGLHALAESFRACGGYIGSRDYLEKGLQAYHEALLTYDGSM
jgi:aspartate aminotransferase-like enzyme